MKEKVDAIRGHQRAKSQFARLSEQCPSESSSNKSEDQKQEGGPEQQKRNQLNNRPRSG